MKKSKKIVSILFFSVCTAHAVPPLFTDAGEIKAGNASIKIGHASPCVVDWNEDGKKDLLVGQYTGGKINFFQNIGTDKAPVLQSPSFLKAGSLTIAYSREQIKAADLNNDGKTDLLVGNGLIAQSRIYFYENTGTNGTPVLKAPVVLMTKGS